MTYGQSVKHCSKVIHDSSPHNIVLHVHLLCMWCHSVYSVFHIYIYREREREIIYNGLETKNWFCLIKHAFDLCYCYIDILMTQRMCGKTSECEAFGRSMPSFNMPIWIFGGSNMWAVWVNKKFQKPSVERTFSKSLEAFKVLQADFCALCNDSGLHLQSETYQINSRNRTINDNFPVYPDIVSGKPNSYLFSSEPFCFVSVHQIGCRGWASWGDWTADSVVQELDMVFNTVPLPLWNHDSFSPDSDSYRL